MDLLRHKGWETVDPEEVARTPLQYRAYVQEAFGEFTVVKNAYVAARSGWFSERSACYLASGRPVVSQDSGFSGVLPTGAGLLAFEGEEEAAEAVASVIHHYADHSRAARAVAEAYFEGGAVLQALIDRV